MGTAFHRLQLPGAGPHPAACAPGGRTAEVSPPWVKPASAGQASASPPPGLQLLRPHSAASRRSQAEQKERRGSGGWAPGAGTRDAPPLSPSADVQTGAGRGGKGAHWQRGPSGHLSSGSLSLPLPRWYLP